MNHSTNMYSISSHIPPICISRVYGPEIGDMDEGIVEGCEDSGNAENELSCKSISFVQYHVGRERNRLEEGSLDGMREH